MGMSPITDGICLGISGLLDEVTQELFFATAIRPAELKNLFLTSLFCVTPLFPLFLIIINFAREQGLPPGVWSRSSL